MKARDQMRIHGRPLAVFGLLGTFLFLRPDAAICQSGVEKVLREFVLDTKAGTLGADISPVGSLIAVDALTGSRIDHASNYVESLEVWDWRERKLITRKELSSKRVEGTDHYDREENALRYSDGGAKIVFCHSELGRLLVFDSQTLNVLREIDLGRDAWPRMATGMATQPHVAGLRVDRSATRAAVLLLWGAGAGGEVRVYELNSGALLRTWNYRSLRGADDPTESFGGMDIDTVGKKVAVTIIPFLPGEGLLRSGDRNLFVLDIDSGLPTSAWNTGYIAGEVRFIGDGELATVSRNPEPRYFSNDSLKIWDDQTGKLLRQIFSRPGGVHYTLETSADGRVGLGYVGLVKTVGHWWLLQEEYQETVYHRFRLWDLASGKAIATSPDLSPSLVYRLSPRGDTVLTFPSVGAGPITLYELEPDAALKSDNGREGD